MKTSTKTNNRVLSSLNLSKVIESSQKESVNNYGNLIIKTYKACYIAKVSGNNEYSGLEASEKTEILALEALNDMIVELFKKNHPTDYSKYEIEVKEAEIKSAEAKAKKAAKEAEKAKTEIKPEKAA